MLNDEIGKQSGEFAVCCIYMSSADFADDKEFSAWPDTVVHAINTITKNKTKLIVEDVNHLTVIVQSSSNSLANKLARLIRNQLMKKYTNARPNMAVAHVRDIPKTVDDLIAGLGSVLKQHIAEKSSRIEVVTY